MQTVNALYPGTELSFYAVLAAICKSCYNNIDVFSAFKSMYTPVFVQALQDSALEAKQMPNNQMRQGASKVLHAAVATANNVCCANAGFLFNYIGGAFAPDVVDAMRKGAGSEVYTKALRYQWDSTALMNLMMTTFMNTHSSALVAAGMAEDFPATCTTGSTAFDAALEAYRDNQTAAKGITTDKIAANNEVYKSLVVMMTDGKLLFANDEYRRKQFMYNEVLKTVRRSGKTGFRIAITNKVMKEPVANAHLSFTNSSVTGITDKKGVVKIEMPEGTFNYMISATGFTTMVGTLTTKKNTMRKAKIEMTAAGIEDTVVETTVKTIKEKAAH